jgi:hypothetical protein
VPVIDSYCPICGSATTYERPPCVDKHGSDCPERVCVRCGAAMLVGVWPRIRRANRRRAA